MATSSGPPPVLYRPIPRRPFVVRPATPPEDGEAKETTQPPPPPPREAADAPDGLSRAQSIRNLTASTLFGIFSPTTTSRGSNTPWGTGGAATPAQADESFEDDGDVAVDDDDDDGGDNNVVSAADLNEVRKASQSLMMLQQQRAADSRSNIELQPAAAAAAAAAAATAAGPTGPTGPARPPSTARRLLSVVGRAALLFTLGMGYGVLVARLRTETHTLDDAPAASSGAAAAANYDASYDWRYLVSWGLSGVVLGTLLPWFDGVWDRTVGRPGGVLGKARTAPDTDWALVVRGIGAFAGVVFAMASLTLALANPFLWYLLDRSKSGLLLAAAVGFVGSAVLMALDLDLMPNPGLHPGRAGHDAAAWAALDAARSGVASFHANGSSAASAAASAAPSAASPASLSPSSSSAGSLNLSVPAVTAETAMWMLSVLFCSCVCFGNIGRRLALRPVAAAERSRR